MRRLSPWLAGVALLGGCGEQSPPGSQSGGHPGVAAAPVDPRALLAQAESLERSGLYVEAGHLLRGGLEAFPAAERGPLELRIASLYHRANVDDLALKYATAALAAGVADPEALFIQGDTQRSLFQPEARATLEKFLAVSPAHAAGRLAYARLLYRSQDPTASLPVFDEYFRLAAADDRDRTVASLEHARALRAAGRHQEAADRFTALLEDDPFDARLYSELASTLYRLRRREEADLIEQIYKALSENAFEEHVELRLREKGATAFALGQQGVNRTRQRRYLDAFDAYRRAVAAEPRDPRLRNFLADLFTRFHRPREALALLDEGLRLGLRPASGLHWQQGLTQLEREAFPDALAAFQRAGAARAEEGDAGGEERGQAPLFPLHLAIARAAIEVGEWDPAGVSLDQAQAASPQSWEPHYWRGRVLFGRGDFAGALARYEEASRRGGESFIDLAYHRGLTLARLGKSAEALALLEQVIGRQPSFAPAHDAYLREGPGAPRAPAVETARTQLQALLAERKTLLAAIEAKPLEQCGPEYHALGVLALKMKDAGGFDDLFLAGDLLPQNAEVCRLLISGMKRPQDVFIRAHYLRRLLRIEPGSAEAMAALVEVYTKLAVRPAEALALATRAHAQKATAVSFRLLGAAQALAGDAAAGLATLKEGLKAFPEEEGLRKALERLEGGSR